MNTFFVVGFGVMVVWMLILIYFKLEEVADSLQGKQPKADHTTEAYRSEVAEDQGR